jgi:hypothetical protein
MYLRASRSCGAAAKSEAGEPAAITRGRKAFVQADACIFQGINNVHTVTIGSSRRQEKTSSHMIIQAEIPSCFGWFPEEEIYVRPVADPFEIAARPNMRKRAQKVEIKEIKQGMLCKSKSVHTFAGMLRFAAPGL